MVNTSPAPHACPTELNCRVPSPEWTAGIFKFFRPVPCEEYLEQVKHQQAKYQLQEDAKNHENALITHERQAKAGLAEDIKPDLDEEPRMTRLLKQLKHMGIKENIVILRARDTQEFLRVTRFFCQNFEQNFLT
jgi:hypothetical protein